MWINEQTAQLILDAITWTNDDWVIAGDEEEWNEETKIMVAHENFIRFCADRGIEGIEKRVYKMTEEIFNPLTSQEETPCSNILVDETIYFDREYETQFWKDYFDYLNVSTQEKHQ